MTSAEIAARGDRWLRAIGYGLLAEISTVVSIIAIVVIHRHVVARGLTEADYTAFSERVGAIVGILGGTLYTFLFARLLMRQLSTRFIAHGIVVALAAVAFSVGGSIAGHHFGPEELAKLGTGYLSLARELLGWAALSSLVTSEMLSKLYP